MAQLVAGAEHRRALRQQRGGEQGALQAAAQGIDAWVVGRSFDAAVVAQVVAVAVAVVFAVGFVVALAVAHQVAQCETVVRDHVVDRHAGGPVARLVHVGRGAQPQGKVAARAGGMISLEPETAHDIAKTVVPFQPAARKRADLVAARTNVPGLGNQLDLRQHRVLRHGGKKCTVGLEAVVAPAKHGCQVEAKAIDMHVADPVAQAVHHQLQDARLADVQRVAAAAVIFESGGRVGRVPIVAGVVESAKAQAWAVSSRLGGVVEHHVQQHLDAMRMQGLDHAAEFIAGCQAVLAGRQLGTERKKGQRVVAPVVAQAHAVQPLFIERKVNR